MSCATGFASALAIEELEPTTRRMSERKYVRQRVQTERCKGEAKGPSIERHASILGQAQNGNRPLRFRHFTFRILHSSLYISPSLYMLRPTASATFRPRVITSVN